MDRDQVRIWTGYAGGSWGAHVDLTGGTITWEGDRADLGTRTIAPHHLDVLRANAATAHAQGDYAYREQFANGEVTFAVILGGKTVSLSHETDGGSTCNRVQPLWDYACSGAPRPGDQLGVWCGGPGSGWGAEVDFASATLRWLGAGAASGTVPLDLGAVHTLHWKARRVLEMGEHKTGPRDAPRDVVFELTTGGETVRFGYRSAGEKGRGWVRAVWGWVEERR